MSEELANVIINSHQRISSDKKNLTFKKKKEEEKEMCNWRFSLTKPTGNEELGVKAASNIYEALGKCKCSI